jgi:galactonate dehydratase
MSNDIHFLAEFAAGSANRSAQELATGAAELAEASGGTAVALAYGAGAADGAAGLGAFGAARAIVLGDEDRPAITYAGAAVAAVRDAVGDDLEVGIGTHSQFSTAGAIRVAKIFEPYEPIWFEEPVPPENWDALVQFRAGSDVPVCVGERLYTRWQFRPVLEGKLADYLMPDVIRTGGISELKKIATMAEAFFVPVSPHDATGPITLIAGAQVMMTTPNFYRLEIAYSELDHYNRAMTPAFDVRDGYFHVSDRPGLGHDLSEQYLREAVPF